MTRKQTIVVLLVLVLGVAMGTMDAEAAYSPPEICAACHGDNGASQHPDIPIIGGLSAFVIEENLFAFRAQERPCRTTFLRNGEPGSATTNMCELAADLSDDDIVAIAAHYAEQPFVPAIQATDEGKAELGASVHHRECRFCHGEGGSDPAPLHGFEGTLPADVVEQVMQAKQDILDGNLSVELNFEPPK